MSITSAQVNNSSLLPPACCPTGDNECVLDGAPEPGCRDCPHWEQGRCPRGARRRDEDVTGAPIAGPERPGSGTDCGVIPPSADELDPGEPPPWWCEPDDDDAYEWFDDGGRPPNLSVSCPSVDELPPDEEPPPWWTEDEDDEPRRTSTCRGSP